MLRKFFCSLSLIPFLILEPVEAQIFEQPAAAPQAQPSQRRRAVQRRNFRPPVQVAPVVAPPAQHLLSSIKFDSTLGEVLPNLHTQAKQVLERAKAQNDYLLARIGADFMLVLANFESNFKAALPQTLKSQDSAIQQFISQTDTLLLTILKNQDRELDINELLQTHNDILAKVPAVRHLPTVYSYTPYVLKVSDLKKPIVLNIKGLSFNYGAAKLQFRGQTYMPTVESSAALTFELEGKDIEGKSEESTLLQANLILIKPSADEKGVENVSLPLTFMVMPMQAGKFNLSYTHIETVNKTELKSVEFNHIVRNGEPECKEFNTKASNPTRVVKNLHEIFKGGESGNSQVSATLISEFTVKLCVKKLNKLAPSAQIVSIWQWEEQWQDHQERQEKLEGSILEGKDDILIDKLPPSLQKFSLTATGLDKRSYNFNGSGDKGLFTLRYNPIAKQMVLGTRPIEPRLQ